MRLDLILAVTALAILWLMLLIESFRVERTVSTAMSVEIKTEMAKIQRALVTDDDLIDMDALPMETNGKESH